MELAKIEVDIEVNRVIEASRTSFSQSKNDILRQMFRLDVAASSATIPKRTRQRVTGVYSYAVNGQMETAASLRDAYFDCLKTIVDGNDDLAEKISRIPLRARRIVAIDPESLYKNNPHLAASHAKKFFGKWWIDLNLSEPQVRTRVELACRAAGLKFGRDVILKFPSDR